MSLLDALLLDPYRDPREIYIALRTDGQRGSGTISDPYDGGTRTGPASATTLTFDRQDVLVASTVAHGYDEDDTVLFGDVAIPMASFFNDREAEITEVLPPYSTESGSFRFIAQLSNLASDPAPPGPPTPKLGAINNSTKVRTDGGLQKDARLYWPVAKIARAGTPAEIVPFDVVSIAGNVSFTGEFVVVALTDDWIYVVLTSLPASTTSPQECTCARVSHRFDEVMRSAPAASVIHIGPGVFETRGRSSLYSPSFKVGFQVQTGQKLRGSGMGLTTLKLVHDLDGFNATRVIANEGAQSIHHFEASDFTIDCNLRGQPVPSGNGFAGVAPGGIALRASFTRLCRIRAIDFGTQAPPECFVIGVNDAYGNPRNAVHNVIEDCVVEQPSPNNSHETTLLHSVGDNYGSAVSPVVRHNFIDCHYVRPDGTRISSEFVAVDPGFYTRVDDSHFTLKTKRPHHREVGQGVRLNGITFGTADNPNHHFFNTAFKVTGISGNEITFFAPNVPVGTPSLGNAYIGVDFHGPAALSGTGCVTEGNALYDCLNAFYTDTGATRDAVVRDNYYSDIGQAVNFSYGGVGAEGPRAARRVNVNLEQLTHNGQTANAKSGTPGSPGTGVPHGLSEGDSVKVSGARINGVEVPVYNGQYLVHIVDAYNFTYEMSANPGANADTPTPANPIQVGLYSLKQDSLNHKIAILEFTTAHGLFVGQVVTIDGARVNGSVNNPYNGNQRIIAVSADANGIVRFFHYAMKAVPNPDQDADAPTNDQPITFQVRWQNPRHVFEGNCYDLYPYDQDSAFASFGIGTHAYLGLPFFTVPASAPFIFPGCVIRENLFRLRDNAIGQTAANGGDAWACRLDNFEITLIENNLINLSGPGHIHHLNSNSVHAFNNRTPAGSHLPGETDISGYGGFFDRDPCLEDKIEEALLASLL